MTGAPSISALAANVDALLGQRRQKAAVSDGPMREALLTLLAQRALPFGWPTAGHLAQPIDWGAFCAVLHRCGLAAFAYRRLVSAGATLPEAVAGWLGEQHEEAVERNRFLLRELHGVTAHLLSAGIPALVLKGPVLAHLGVGALVRTYHDLDVLVPRSHFTRAVETLRTLGFVELPETHGFHQAMLRVRAAPEPATAVEVHFDLADRGHPYAPDVDGVWERAVDLDLCGGVVRTPELTDHVLLTMMQLPHHHFDPRLLLDVASIVHAHGTELNWEQLIRRSNAWGMRVLVGSVLSILGSLLRVQLPSRASAFAEPAGYVRGLQWRIARRAFLDHLSRFPGGKTADLAPFVLVDRVRSMGYLLRQRILREWDREAGGLTGRSR